MEPRAPWDLARDLPWHPFHSPIEQAGVMPSFLIGEYLFYACALVALWHARKHGRTHLLVWIAALCAGTANDLIFMALPFVDNFWQAQATVMLTPRLPLYIPCVYVCFMYYPTVAVWRLGLPPLARAAATGLAAIIFYAPYDIVGARFLWWTWHNTDPRITHRILGAPIGSTLWVITFVAAFAFLVRFPIDRDPNRDGGDISNATFAKGLTLATLLSSLTMVLQMTVLQFFDARLPGPRGLAACAIVYLILIASAWKRRAVPQAPAADKALHRAAVVYFVALTAMAIAFDPKSHVSLGLHQRFGPCGVEATDIQGLTRHEFACAAEAPAGATVECTVEPPADGAQWYTVCGEPEHPRGAVIGVVAALAVAGVALYTYLLRRRRVFRASVRACRRSTRPPRLRRSKRSRTRMLARRYRPHGRRFRTVGASTPACPGTMARGAVVASRAPRVLVRHDGG